VVTHLQQPVISSANFKFYENPHYTVESWKLKVESCLPMATTWLVSYKVQSPMHQMLSVCYSQVVSPVENSTFIKTYKDIIHFEKFPRKLKNIEHELHEGKAIPSRFAKCYTHKLTTLIPSQKVHSHWIFGLRWDPKVCPTHPMALHPFK
jgi:hypothetical protein